MKKKGLSFRVVSLVMVADIIQFVIMVCFKKISELMPQESLSDPSRWREIAWIAVQSHYLWIAFAGMVAGLILWPAVLAALDLSVAFPLGSLSFVLVPVLSIVFLGEEISLLRWLGILVITAGIALLSVSERRPLPVDPP